MILEEEVPLVDLRFEYLKVRHQLARCTTRSPVARDPGRCPCSEAGLQRTRTIISYLRRTPTRAEINAVRRAVKRGSSRKRSLPLAFCSLIPRSVKPPFGPILPTRRRRRRGIAQDRVAAPLRRPDLRREATTFRGLNDIAQRLVTQDESFLVMRRDAGEPAVADLGAVVVADGGRGDPWRRMPGRLRAGFLGEIGWKVIGRRPGGLTCLPHLLA